LTRLTLFPYTTLFRSMHGGLVTTLADEIAAWTVLGMKECFGFTAAIEARLSAPVRIGVEVEGRGTITTDGPRLVKVEVTLTQARSEEHTSELQSPDHL